MTSIAFNQLTLGSLARIALICNACLWLTAGVLLGIASFFGASTTSFNGARTVGLPGLLTGILVGVALTLAGTLAMLVGGGLSRVIGGLLGGLHLQLKS